VVGLALAGRPFGSLAGHDAGQAVEIGDDGPIDGLVEPEEPGLVGEELANGDPPLAGLSEFRPVCADPLVVIEPAAGVGEEPWPPGSRAFVIEKTRTVLSSAAALGGTVARRPRGPTLSPSL
jgi:hypothetical protein